MGQVADDYLEGLACSACGIYFKRAHGYPVICRHCAKTWDEQKYGPPPPTAIHKELA